MCIVSRHLVLSHCIRVSFRSPFANSKQTGVHIVEIVTRGNRMCWQIFCRYFLSFFFVTTVGTWSVYVATALASTKYELRKNERRDAPSRKMNSATDAAAAMNSIEFISHLISYKADTTDIKTYTQTLTQSSCENNHATSNGGVSSWIFGSGMKSSGCDLSNSVEPESNMDHNHHFAIPHTTHVTVIEYFAQLWFLPAKREVQFRETIRVLTISDDGQSSTVECITQYHNGSRWIDCSRVICKLTSVPFVSVQNNSWRHRSKDQRVSVQMSLDGEVLVWLPLPKAASKTVGKKIISTFKTAALDFFHELDTIEI